MIHEIKDFNGIAVKRVKHTELILTVGAFNMSQTEISCPLYGCVSVCTSTVYINTDE